MIITPGENFHFTIANDRMEVTGRTSVVRLAHDHEFGITHIELPDAWGVETKEITDLNETDDKTTVVESATGGRKGQKIQRYDMIPTDSLDELATRYGKGEAKYPTEDGDMDNWRKGYNWSLSFAAAFRHLTAALGGEDIDPDTGDKHVTAVAWHMFTLIHYMNDPERYGQFDDRQAMIERRVENRERNRDLVEQELKKIMDPDVYDLRQRMLNGLYNQTSRKDV